MNDLPKDLQNIINNYIIQIETNQRYQKCLMELKKEFISRKENIGYIPISSSFLICLNLYNKRIQKITNIKQIGYEYKYEVIQQRN